MTNSIDHFIPDEDEHLTRGWEPGLDADDSIVRNYLLTLTDRLETTATATGGRFLRTDEVVLCDLGSSYVFDNIAVVLGPWPTATHRDVVRTAGEYFGSGRAFVCLTLNPSVDLRPFGFELLGHPPLMWRPAGGTGPTTPAELDVRRVETVEQLSDFEQTLIVGYPLPEGGAIADPRLLDRGLSAWVGYVDGEPVGTAGSHTAHGLTEIEWVSTLPDHRGRGYGAALTWLATTSNPDTPAVLLASDDGRPVYRRLGYVAVLRLTMWLRPATSESPS
jgi:GNAT superfamily N-acetyltransferase